VCNVAVMPREGRLPHSVEGRMDMNRLNLRFAKSLGITAFLDEKGLESQNLFYEEYLNDVKAPDDPTLEVDIYVLLK